MLNLQSIMADDNGFVRIKGGNPLVGSVEPIPNKNFLVNFGVNINVDSRNW